MCMQTALIEKAKLDYDDNFAKYGEKGNPDETPVVPKYDFPKFTRVQSIGGLINWQLELIYDSRYSWYRILLDGWWH